MTLEGMSPGVIATIVIVGIIALVLLVFYFVCRSDDPARDHTCVALLYPRTRRELQQLRIPLDPVTPTDIGVNSAFEEDNEENTKTRNDLSQTENQVHTDTTDTRCVLTVHHGGEKSTNKTKETEAETSEVAIGGFDTVELKPAASE